MTKRTFVTALIVTVAVVLAAGGLMASNMGFKLNYNLLGQATGVSAAGDNVIGLPYNRQAGLALAGDLQTDIGFTQTLSLADFDPTGPGFPPVFTGRKGGGANFSLDSCECYFVKMAAGVNLDYIMVGSHDPSLTCQLTGQGNTLPGGGTSASGDNFFTPPYHTTAPDAAGLQTDIGFAATLSIADFDRVSGGFPPVFTGRKGGGANFTLNPGECYFVKIAAGTTVNYLPSHF